MRGNVTKGNETFGSKALGREHRVIAELFRQQNPLYRNFEPPVLPSHLCRQFDHEKPLSTIRRGKSRLTQNVAIDAAAGASCDDPRVSKLSYQFGIGKDIGREMRIIPPGSRSKTRSLAPEDGGVRALCAGAARALI